MEGKIKRFADAAELAQGAADQFISLGAEAIEHHGYFTVVLSGGSTPKRLFQLLADGPYRAQIEWGKVFVFWGDERSVGPDDPESNYGMANEFLLSKVPIPASNIFRIQGEIDPTEAAMGYEEAILAFFAHNQTQSPGNPRFDLVHLGMGDDGHTLSLFPDTEATRAAAENKVDKYVVANYIAKFETWRITMTTKLVNNAANISFLAGGANKASVLSEVINGPMDLVRLPSQLVRPTSGQLTWMVDAAAASELL